MTNYDIIARIDVRRVLRFAPELTPQVLERGLAGATVKAWGGDPYNQVAFRVQLKRPTHEQALSEIEQLIGQFAFYVAEATVSELAGDAVESAIIETFGSGGIVTALAAVAAGFTEAVAGGEANKIRRDYEARQDHRGCWSLAKLPRQKPREPERSLDSRPPEPSGGLGQNVGDRLSPQPVGRVGDALEARLCALRSHA